MIPIQYKYNLQYFQIPVSVFDEVKGEYVDPDPSQSKWVDCGKCRDEGNGSGRHINTETGEVYLYSWVIYVPISSAKGLNIPLGSKVRVLDDDGNVRALKELVRIEKNQLNVRLWL